MCISALGNFFIFDYNNRERKFDINGISEARRYDLKEQAGKVKISRR
jgi:hypothetical protein